jgi:hypothetical protein
MPAPPPVPPFLQGVWSRRFIKRIDGEGNVGPPNPSPVRYVQTPHAFVDVRSIGEGTLPGTTCMAFAGVTTASATPPPGAGSWAGGGGAKRVYWHACHQFGGQQEDSEGCWEAALGGTPRETEDVGDFLPLEGWTGNVWRETDPDGTLEEEWERISDGDGCFLAVRRPGALLVVAGNWFGYAEDHDSTNAEGAGGSERQQHYAAGEIGADGWRVVVCTDRAHEGESFRGLAGSSAEDGWSLLPGSSVAWPPAAGELLSLPRFRYAAPPVATKSSGKPK